MRCWRAKVLKYKYILWDWNGTLLNDVQLCLDIANTLLHERGLPVQSLEDYRRRFDFPIIEYYKRAGFDFEKESFETLSVYFIEAYESRRSGCALYDHARLVLEAFSGHATQAILSAYKQDTLDTLVDEHGLRGYFSHIQGHGDIYAQGKQASAEILMEVLGAHGDQTVLIGDTLHDLEIAEHIGAACVLVAQGHQHIERLLTSHVPVVRSLDELLTICRCD